VRDLAGYISICVEGIIANLQARAQFTATILLAKLGIKCKVLSRNSVTALKQGAVFS
jgi:hypothetical protein